MVSRISLSVVFVSLFSTLAAQPARLRPYPQKKRILVAEGDQSLPASLRKGAAPGPLGPVLKTPDGVTWIGSREGLVRWQPADPPRDRYQFFAGKRYLPDDEVLALAADAPHRLWVRTRTGVSRLDFPPMRLEEKAAFFEDRIEQRHNRHGMVADSHLARPGDLSSNERVSSDNDGLWTAMYGAAECFRYAVTRSPEALQKAKRSVEALLELEAITGRPGFPARSYIKPGETKPRDGFWYPAADGQRQWKADTSSDESVGHFFLFSIAYDLLPDEPLRERIRGVVARQMDHILDNGYYLIDVTGKPTRWGRWSPEYFATPTGKPDAPLNALELLSFLRAARHITGNVKYDAAYEKAARPMGYAALTARHLEMVEELNYSDEELAMLSFYLLFRYGKDAALLPVYRRALDQWWKNIQREENPLWTLIYRYGQPGATASRVAPTPTSVWQGPVWTLNRIPLDLISWTVKNSHRADIQWETGQDRFGRRQALTLLPPDERPVMKWNGNPFIVDGGNDGRSEDDGAFFLLPYWMGRYLGAWTEN
jgi:hypothetical protein